MIEKSFVVLPGIGTGMEASFWRQGISGWEEFVKARKVEGVSEKRWQVMRGLLESAIELNRNRRLREIGLLLPARERWRLLSRWDDRYASLDIEAVGRGARAMPVVVSICRGERPCKTFVKGDDLSWRSVSDFLRGVDFLVTFNGGSFDIPMLAKSGYDLIHPIHIDLRGHARRAGFIGGLKEIEKRVGVLRRRELEYATSEQVSYLWRLWTDKGSKNALDMLIGYNQQDARSLLLLSSYVYRALAEKTLKGAFPDIRVGGEPG